VAEPDWLDDEEQRAWRSWITMSEWLRAQVARDLQRDAGLSDADYVVLVQLSEAPEHRVRMTDLAARLRWSKSRLSHQVARMEARRLLERQNCPNDARGAFAVLTPSGLAEIRRAAPDHLASVRRHFIDLLDRDQLRQLTSIAETVLGPLAGGTCAEDTEAGDCPPTSRSDSCELAVGCGEGLVEPDVPTGSAER
jgi:DNA-binding MarR family transcriptional regulator